MNAGTAPTRVSVDPMMTSVWPAFTEWRRAHLDAGHADTMRTSLLAYRPAPGEAVRFLLTAPVGEDRELGTRSAAIRALRITDPTR